MKQELPRSMHGVTVRHPLHRQMTFGASQRGESRSRHSLAEHTSKKLRAQNQQPRQRLEELEGRLGLKSSMIAGAGVKELDETGLGIAGKTQWLHVLRTSWLTFYRSDAKWADCSRGWWAAWCRTESVPN